MRRANKAPVDNLTLDELKAVYQEVDSKQKGQCRQMRETLRRRRQGLTRDLWALVVQKMKDPTNPVIECDNISSYSNLNSLFKAFQINVRISAGPHKDGQKTPVSFYVWWTSRGEEVQRQTSETPLPYVHYTAQLGDEAKQLLERSHYAYRHGAYREALKFAQEAKKASIWPHPAVAAQLLKVLLQFPRDVEIENIFADIHKAGMATDEIMLLKARWHFETGSLEETRAALSSVRVIGTRNLSYQTALYNMAVFAREGHALKYLYLAHRHFVDEIKSFPDSYWARVCLSISCRVLKCSEHKVSDKLCREQLAEQISKYPENSTPRFFRLLHTMVLDRQKDVINLVNRDRRECKQSMQVSVNLLNLLENALRLLYAEEHVAILKAQLSRWMAPFDILL
jgi:hypothetical protein